MKSSTNILIVCRDIRDMHFLSTVSYLPNNKYIIASDDIRVHQEIEKFPWVKKVCFIESMESFYHVADDVIAILNEVNKWLKSFADDKQGISEDLLFWICHCEGGMTTQRIQDLLLLIRSYENLIDCNNISDLKIISRYGMFWEDQILIEIARSKGIHVDIMERFYIRTILGKQMYNLRMYAIGFYYICNLIWLKFRSNIKAINAGTYNKDILFQLCGSAYYHVQNIIPLMKALRDKKYNPIALCWNVATRPAERCGSDKIRAEGLLAEDLEKFVPIKSIYVGIYKIIHTWKKTKSQYQQFLSNPAFCYRSLPLGRFLWPSVQYFFIAELIQRYFFYQSLKTYFECHFPVAIKIWGDGVLPEGNLVLKNQDVQKRKPLTFCWFWVPLESPYDSKSSSVDLYLSAGKWQKKYLTNRGVSDSRIALAGMWRFDDLIAFKKSTSSEQSAFHLGITAGYSIYVLYDPGYIIRGYCSANEKALIIKCLLDLAKNYPSMALLVKPHPEHQTGYLETIIATYSLSNVYLLAKNMSSYYSINIADLLITKYSTLGIEAMLFERPVLSACLDNEPRFNIYKDAAELITSIEQLSDLLKKLVNNNIFRDKWRANQIDMQRLFINDIMGKYYNNNADHAADVLLNAIGQKHGRVNPDGTRITNE